MLRVPNSPFVSSVLWKTEHMHSFLGVSSYDAKFFLLIISSLKLSCTKQCWCIVNTAQVIHGECRRMDGTVVSKL